MSIRSSPAGTAAAPQGGRLKTVLSAGLGRLSMQCTPCRHPMTQDDLIKNYGTPPLEDPAGRTPSELEDSHINTCSICNSLLAGPPQADPSLPTALEKIQSSGHWYHRWCLAQWVRDNDTCPNTRKRILQSEEEGLLLFRPRNADVWPIPVMTVQQQQAIDAVSQDGMRLEDQLLSMRNDKGVVMAAVTHDGRALQYASAALKNDREVVLAAVAEDGEALMYAPDALKRDKEVVLVAVSSYPFALEFASPARKQDRDLVLVAVTLNGFALEFASAELKGDKSVVLAAVTKDGRALKYASDALKDDKDVVLAAVTKDGRALYYASDALKNDSEVVERARSITLMDRPMSW